MPASETGPPAAGLPQPRVIGRLVRMVLGLAALAWAVSALRAIERGAFPPGGDFMVAAVVAWFAWREIGRMTMPSPWNTRMPWIYLLLLAAAAGAGALQGSATGTALVWVVGLGFGLAMAFIGVSFLVSGLFATPG